jgi:hypothetical protein
VELIVDAATYDDILPRGRVGQTPPVEGFATDSQAPSWERWCVTETERVFRDLEEPLFYVVAGGGTRVTIVVRERTSKCRTALMRVVRELAMVGVVSSGGTVVHGAAVRARDGVVVLSGPKRSGKTTLLMALLHAAAAHYVSNDRCVLRAGEAGVVVRGLPTLVSIRRDTLDHFPAARRRLDTIRPDLARDWADRTSFSLGPPAFRALMGGCPGASGGPLRALIFPRLSDAPERLALCRLGPDAARTRFRQGLFRANRPSQLGDVFVSPAVAGGGGGDVERWIAERVPCFDARLGGGAPPDGAECRALLEQVATA